MTQSRILLLALVSVLSCLSSVKGVKGAPLKMRFGQLRYAICSVEDRETILRNRINLAHLHCPASAGAYNGLPERAEFERQMAAWQKGAEALRAAGVHPLTYIAPDMWYGDAEQRTELFDFYDKRWEQYADYLGPKPADPLAWTQRKADGTPIPYVYEGRRGYYWCTNQPACRQYVQGVIRMHLCYGSHGIFFDGPCNHGCYCGECQRQFREFLRTHYPSRLRERILDGQRLEELRLPTERKNLALWTAMRRFRSISLARFLRDMRAFGRSLCPDFLLTNNYCLWAGDALGMISLGEDAEMYAREVDILFDEAMYGGGPHLAADGVRVSNSFHYDYLVAAAQKKPAVCTFMGVKEAPPEGRYALAWLEIAEAWASQCIKMQQTFREEAIVRAFGEAGAFQCQHPELFAPAQRLGDVGVWISLQQAYVGQPHWGLAMPRLLIDAGFAFRVLTDGMITAQELRSLRCLVVPGAAALTDAQRGALRAYLRAGGAIVAFGPLGVLDEYGLPRAAAESEPFGPGPEKGQIEKKIGRGRIFWIPAEELQGLPNWTRTPVPAAVQEKIASAIRHATGPRLLLAEAPPESCELRLYAVSPKRWRAYLVNYGVTKEGKINRLENVGWAIRLPAGCHVAKAYAYSYEHKTPQIVNVGQQGEITRLVLPQLQIWAVVDIQLK